MSSISVRDATPADAPALVDIVLMAGEGLPERVWAEMAHPGETLRDVGLRRAARGEGSFSFRNAQIATRNGDLAGGMVGYPLPDDPVPIGPDFPAEFVPLQELENLAPSTWYLNIVGVYDGMRGQGVGSALLAHAEGVARRAGLRAVSLIVFSGNPGARRLYERAGFRERARRRMHVPGWEHDGANAILMVKSV
ncbi:GNAT family N-acetyltransferase [Defluviimonas sp. WL0002]|uniref:GNAT family N-acetyltransferase n=1 Tax=Albidovulum marisflavi TaxID=2984159 RepID=A0ABT2ZEU5_9RHOB|nr:GNAT family N-acetyltransferase [Defluviimonas sp. WL0002]MCV2869542.1 GNAT family N-acetyltransferase [Defluviimonas sp. WL0002]